MSGDPHEQKDPRDHDWGVERAKPTENSGRVWNWSWQAQTHARDETVLLCAAGGDGCYSPSVVSPFTSGRLVVCLQSFSSSADSSSSLSRSVSRSSLCHSSELPVVSSASHALLLMWACGLSVSSLLDSEHTHAHSFSLARTVSRCPSILSLFSPQLPPPPSLSRSCSLSLALPLT